jgi:hypothetical protein
LLIVVLARLRSLGKAIVALSESQPDPKFLVRQGEELKQSIRGELKGLEEQISGFDIIFSEIQNRLNILRPDRPAAAPTAAVSRQAPGPSDRAVPAPPAPALTASLSDQDVAETPGRPEHDDLPTSPTSDRGPVANDAPSPAAVVDRSEIRLQELVREYRELIAEPRKNEINRWCDEAGGWACEVGDDGTLRPLTREAGGLLVLIALEDRIGVVVPGGRLVVDFPTDFANAIAMRRVTRHAFELVNDGTGILRLTEAAEVERVGDKWQLVRPGTLAGLKSE